MNGSFVRKRRAIAAQMVLAVATLALPLCGAQADGAAVVTIQPRGAVGGGWSDAGPMGEYFAGDKLEGTPAFTRREVRIDFDWGTLLPVGGSSAEPYRSFPHEHFSARWLGKIIPRFSESYVFAVTADRKPVFWVKDASNGTRTEIPLKGADQKFVSAPVAMKAGQGMELGLEYHHGTGAAMCALAWSSPSTPQEVVDPVCEQGVNIASFSALLWADREKDRRWGSEDAFDENGQLATNKGSFGLAESTIPTPGRYLMSFTGYANVETWNFAGSKFIVDGKEYAKLTAKGPGYDAAKNQTRAIFQVPEYPPSNRMLKFSDAFRDPAGTQPGITDFHMMRPMEKGSDTPCPVDAIVYPPMRRMAAFFTCVRYLDVANCHTTPFWTDRSPGTYARFYRGEHKARKIGTGGENWEYLVMFANESGRDLYLCTPMLADDEYFHKLALLLRYGSDGVEPYTQPTANPRFPPLNSNLHLYFEVGNEIWNWGFPSSQDDSRAAREVVEQNTEEGKIINYDGKASYRRYHAVRTVKASNAFREVFGNAAMCTRIRPLLEFQYANAQETARSSFSFLDNYYNNGDGEHVKDPHPARYHVWGGGGAAYYGVGNGEGVQSEVVCKDPGFEEAVAGEGEKITPKSGAWTFTGSAGVYRAYSSAVVSYTPGKPAMNQPAKTAIGMRFTTGEKPLWVYKLGRVYTHANDKGARISILKTSDLSRVTQAETGPVQAFVAKILGYYWAELPDQKPVQLEARTEYLLVSQDLAGASRVEGFDCAVKLGNGLATSKAVKVTVDDPENTRGWHVEDGAADCCPGPVTMLYAERGDLVTDLPQPSEGVQAAYVSGLGEISQQVNFPKAGSFAITLNIADCTAKGQRRSGFRFYCDDQNASPVSQGSIRGDSEGFGAGGFGRVNGFKEDWGSAVFTIDKPGLHTLRFAGTSKEKNPGLVVLDNIRIASVDALLTSGFGGGSALGQPVENEWDKSQAKDSRFGISFGLPRVSYETGWSVGGDFYQKPIQNWCKLVDPRSGKINDQAIDLWRRTGGYLPVWGVYTYWVQDDCEHGETYPVMQSIIHANQHLPADPDNGATLPAELTGKNCIEWSGARDLKAAGQFMSWTVIFPETAVYQVTLEAAAGGKYSIDFDGQSLGAVADSGTPATYHVQATRGIHGVLLRCKEGAVVLPRIRVTLEKTAP